MGRVAIDPISSEFGGKALAPGPFMYPSMEEKLILHADLNSAHSSKEAAIFTCRTAEEEKDDAVEKRIVHLDSKSTFTKVAATYARNHHGQSKMSQATAWTQAGKGRTACKHGSSPYSPSESDSSSSSSSLFEESSTPCTSETSASSVKGELSPVAVSTVTPLRLSMNPMQPKPARVRTSLQSHFDAMPISKWEAAEPARKGPPEDDCFLEFNFLEGRMIESLMDPPHASVSRLSCESPQQDSIREQESSSIELSDEEWANGSTTPAFYSASAHSPESSSENSFHSGDASSLPSLDLEVKHVVVSKESAAEHDHSFSIKKTMDSDTLLHHAPSHTVEDQKEACVSHDLHSERVESNSQTSSICVSRRAPKEDSCNSVAFEADIGVDRVFLKSDVKLKQTPSGTTSDASLCGRSGFPQSFSFHSSPAKLESSFSFQPTPLLNASKLKGKTRPSSQAFREGLTKQSASLNADMLLVKSKLGTANPRVLEKQPISSKFFDRHISSVHPRNDKHKAKHEDGLKSYSVTFSSMMFHHPAVPPNVKKLSPLAHNAPNHLEKADEFTPVFPQPQHEGRGGTPANLQSSGIFKHQPAPAHTPLDWRSKSLSARASLRSAVRNLEAAFGGSSRSVSLPKARPHNTQKDSKSDSVRLLDRVFVSPMKSRLKHADPLKLAQNPPTPTGYFLQANDSRRSGMHSRKDAKAVSFSTLVRGQMKPVAQLLPPINHKQNNSDLEVSCKPFLPTSRSIHCLPSQKPSFVEVDTPPSDLKPAELLPSRSKVPSSMLQGYLQCILRDGVPCYALTMDNSDEVLLGRACVLESHSSKDGCSWMYTLQSAGCKSRAKGTGGWKNWIRKVNKSCTEVAGKMQVSSVLCPEVSPNGDISHSMVFEFVLFDGRVEDAGRTQSLRFSSPKSCQEKPTSSMEGSPLSTSHVSVGFASPPSLSTVSTSPTDAEAGLRSSQSGLFSPMTANMGHRASFSLDIWSDSELAGPGVERLSPSMSHKELAAMVIRLHVDDNKTLTNLDDRSSSRHWLEWGLRFLDTEVAESGDNGYGVPRTLSLSAVNGDSIVKYGAIATGKTFGRDWLSPDYKLHFLMQRPDQQSSQANRKCAKVHAQHGEHQTLEYVSVLLPRGDHGLPNEGVSGPSSLIQRWRSGGKCDCGGWDLGCGLKVLSTDLVKNGTTSHSSKFLSLSQDKPLNIFSQGSDQEVMLSLTVVQQGLYVLSFQTELSPLRSFATAIAILHSKQFSSKSDTWVKMGSLKERPTCPSQSHLVQQTNSETHSDVNPYRPAQNPFNSPPPLWSL